MSESTAMVATAGALSPACDTIMINSTHFKWEQSCCSFCPVQVILPPAHLVLVQSCLASLCSIWKSIRAREISSRCSSDLFEQTRNKSTVDCCWLSRSPNFEICVFRQDWSIWAACCTLKALLFQYKPARVKQEHHGLSLAEQSPLTPSLRCSQ
jgi:hypothetical protein